MVITEGFSLINHIAKLYEIIFEKRAITITKQRIEAQLWHRKERSTSILFLS